MRTKPVVLRAAADRDIQSALDHYAGEVGERLSGDFVIAVERCLTAIADYPGGGSPRYAHELELPGLRTARLPGFPYLAFYIECDDRIEVWRVLHDRRNIPTWMGQDDA